MRVRALDENNDWTFGKGQNDYKTARAAVAQNIKTRLQSFLGDCFFSISSGIDWFNLLGTKNQLALNLAVSATVLNTTGVLNIVSSSMRLDTDRRLSFTFSVNTIFGEVFVTSTGAVDFLLLEGGSILTTESGSGFSI